MAGRLISLSQFKVSVGDGALLTILPTNPSVAFLFQTYVPTVPNTYSTYTVRKVLAYSLYATDDALAKHYVS